MSFIGVAIGASTAIGAASSIYGAKKQSQAAKKGADTQMAMFDTINRQQQPFIQSGYNAMGRLNTLLGIGNRPVPVAPPNPGAAPGAMYRGVPRGGNNLRRLLALRATHGDRAAQQVSELMP